MGKYIQGILLLLVTALPGNMAPVLAAGDTIHHNMSVSLEPAAHRLTAVDVITIPASLAHEGMILQVNSALRVSKLEGDARLTALPGDETGADIGIDRENDNTSTAVRVTRYALTGVPSGAPLTLTLKLAGVINNPIVELAQEYARGFSQSSGLIEERGVYLTGATYWVPTVADTMLTYDLSVDLPEGWSSVSQGARQAPIRKDARVEPKTEGDRHLDGWVAHTPTEEIYLIAAEFHEYALPAGNVMAMAFLRTPDDALANKYLETTAQYLEMYRGLLGPYPYSKFALVENFWETGYGMPSFTLLGPQVIRFPFILHSSYPHELLHNWWGNGVFIDFDKGNWAEGLTAYMADHLVAEQRGQGGAYRRAILQRYTNYVDAASDFPIREFRSRHNAVTEAVGYGKTSMTWNMLRVLVGDDDFRRSFQRFYRQHKFTVATFDDVRASFEEVTGRDLKAFFDQWVDRIGAPELRIEKARQKRGKLNLSLAQIQAGELFSLRVDVAVYTADTVTIHQVQLDKRTEKFEIDVEGDVVRVEVDPEFNLFRRLHWAETPPSLGNAFGAEDVVMILPAAARPDMLSRYEKLASIWTGSGDQLRVVRDNEIETLPEQGAIWVLGAANRFYGVVQKALADYDAETKAGVVRFGEASLDLAKNSTVIAVRNPENPDSVVVGITIHSDAAVAGLARKLPHYGKYSYLAFANDAPDNSAKGEWPAVGSPLVAVLDEGAGTTAKLQPRPALAELAPVFDGRRMMAHVEYLASPALEGRGVGEPGLDEAADYIAKIFADYGLQPGGDSKDGKTGWFQSFQVPGPATERDGKLVAVRNVVGIIPGKNPALAGQSVVVSAHYDHLGHGWPNVRAAFKGQIHPGADDNASGVAVILELAKSMAKSNPDRTIVFLATTAEESGLLGARHYVKAMQAYPAKKAIGNLNLDTVGRAVDKFLVFGGNSASEWRFIFLGITAVTGIQAELVMQEIAASDHTAFAEIGVPAIHLFGSANEGYHRPSDTADQIDPASLVKAAAISKEVVAYLSTRLEPLTSTLGGGQAAAPVQPARPGGGRRVSTGSMPDFTFAGPGVKVSSVAEGSAGAKAGLLAGDVITAFGGMPVNDLRAYTTELGKYAPGDKVLVTVLRDGAEVTLELVLAAR